MAYMPYSYRNDPKVPNFSDDKPVFVFDGHCVLCSRWTDMMLRHDTERKFRLIAAQSELGEALFVHYDLKSDTGDYATNLLIQDGHAHIKSDGTLALMTQLGYPFVILGMFRIIPRTIRDWAYELIARNRMTWFGRRELCYVPKPEDKDRFL